MNRLVDIILAKENRWQVIFWALILFLAPIEALLGEQDLIEAFVLRFFGLFTKMIAAYQLAYYLIPRYLFKKRYLHFFLYLLVLAIGLSILARIINVHLAERIILPNEYREPIWQIIQEYRLTFDTYFGRVFSIALWFLFFKFGIDQLRNEQQLTQLRQEKAEAELNFLKSQIHPHFLFNTLNNLYTLTLEKSDEAPEVVVKLSEMLDYLLYQCNTPSVPIQKEIELINNYIGLESLRYGKRLALTFNHSLENTSAMVAPLLLLSPIENAFKHGVSGVPDQSSITIDLRVKNNHLRLLVENTKASTAITDERAYTSGIGLSNVRSQLALIYPNRHQLTIQDYDDHYSLDLRIDL